jgi:hypothetical protein
MSALCWRAEAQQAHEMLDGTRPRALGKIVLSIDR